MAVIIADNMERNLLMMEMRYDYDEIEMMDFEHFSVHDRMTMDKETRFGILANILAEEQLWDEERQGRGGSLAMHSGGSSTLSQAAPPSAAPLSNFEELLGPAFEAANVVTEIFVSMAEILAVGGFLGALGFAVHVLGPTAALARLLGLTSATAPALGTPMITNQDRSRRPRKRRWGPDLCYLCNRNEVSYFFSCCQDLVCYGCASGRGPAMCRCTSMRRAVAHRPQYSPLPRRTVRLLPHPIWQIYSISEEHNFIVIRYFRPEDAAYSQETVGIRYTFHFFFMEGARWTRHISAWYIATPHAQVARIFRIFLIEHNNPEGNNEAESL